MKKVVIEVYNGLAEVMENKDNVKVAIIDHDALENKININDDEDVIVEVFKGFAEITKCKNNIDVKIIDHDINKR